ncbi:penicillin-binding transpeptidase domain-containing protein [Planotetraspora mira]|uniref:penicillin-binding transpeptidase domain-containing protein n=1 Tax=Planotetraspora mira TaxID=58121 RepID=UPI0019524E2B|nr:penicillin-binding transpeptidase domain-containing protein [Planotetraspora mira]
MALLAVVVSSMMLTVLGRLWYLQVVSGPYYAKAAADSRLRTVPLPAPWGRILAADGRPLTADTLVGRGGLETWYRADLAGRAGVRELAVDSRGTVTRVLGERGPRPGNTLTTSVDPRIQRLAERALAALAAKAGRESTGAVVVLETSTGRVIALAGHAGRATPARHGGAMGLDTESLSGASGALIAQRAPGTARAITSQGAAAAFGFGRRTGIDLPNEATGYIPDSVHPEHGPAAGQGEVLVTPLQLATAYAAAVNGGTLFSPRLAMTVLRPDGTVVRTIAPPAAGRVAASPETLRGIRHALAAIPSPDTALDAHGGPGTSWSACYVPAETPRYVVVVVSSRTGGHAAESAARTMREGIPRLGGTTRGT